MKYKTINVKNDVLVKLKKYQNYLLEHTGKNYTMTKVVDELLDGKEFTMLTPPKKGNN